MKRLIISIFAFSIALQTATSQAPRGEIAATSIPLSEVELVALPLIDNEALLEAELSRRAPGVAPRFAEALEVDITPESYGLWELLPDGTAVWRLRIQSAGAHSLNFGFLEYFMPPGGKLLIYGPMAEKVMGPFTPSDNEAHQQLWTPVLAGDEAVLEVQVPARQRNNLRLRLATINHDFLGFLEILSGACNLDVICGADNGWGLVDLYRDVIQSVAVYGLGGDTFCTGFLINNSRQDCTPYFMTAYHCDVTAANAPSLVAYWNYQNSYCRQPGTVASGGSGDGLLNQFNTGAVLRAAHADSDFSLLELDDPIPVAAEAFFAGWSREVNPPQDTLACIHHPDGAEKRITFSFHNTYPGAWGNGSNPVNNGNHLIIPDWDIGSTESGSSGAPLFNRQQRIVGQLHGGAASCNNNQYDSFGWFRYSWNGGGTPTTRLKDWLDPDNTNLLVLDGRRLSSCTATLLVSAQQPEVCLPGTITFEVEVAAGFTGPVTLSTQGLAPGAIANFSPNPAQPGSTSTLTVSLYGPNPPSGNISFFVLGEGGNNASTAEASFLAISQLPAAPAVLSPANEAAGLSLAPAFQWTAIPMAESYDLQVAANASFDNIIASHTGLPDNSCDHVILSPLSTYYCRVRANNICGAGPWSPTVRWTTSATTCQAKQATDGPRPISDEGISVAYSEIIIPDGGTVASISLSNIDIDHSYVGDLSAFLRSPSGTTVQLFNRPGVPVIYYGCWGSGLFLGFADDAALSQANFEAACDIGPPAIEGVFRPITPLSSLIGEPVTGAWRLTIVDHQDQDGGQLNGWQLNLCRTYPREAQLFGQPETLPTCVGQPASLEVYVGAGFENPVSLHLIGAPSGTTVSYSSNPTPPGQYANISFDSFNQAGSYPAILNASDGIHSYYSPIQIQASDLPEPPLLFIPDDESPLFQDELFFSWSPAPNADTFLFEIATDPLFEEIVKKDMVPENFYTLAESLPGGAYFWRVTALNRCGGQMSNVFSFFMEGAVSNANEPTLPGKFLVFPNPARDVLHISWQDSGPVPLNKAELYSAAGQLVRQISFRARSSISLSQLPAGLYMLVLYDGERQSYQRIVVQ